MDNHILSFPTLEIIDGDKLEISITSKTLREDINQNQELQHYKFNFNLQLGDEL